MFQFQTKLSKDELINYRNQTQHEINKDYGECQESLIKLTNNVKNLNFENNKSIDMDNIYDNWNFDTEIRNTIKEGCNECNFYISGLSFENAMINNPHYQNIHRLNTKHYHNSKFNTIVQKSEQVTQDTTITCPQLSKFLNSQYGKEFSSYVIGARYHTCTIKVKTDKIK